MREEGEEQDPGSQLALLSEDEAEGAEGCAREKEAVEAAVKLLPDNGSGGEEDECDARGGERSADVAAKSGPGEEHGAGDAERGEEAKGERGKANDCEEGPREEVVCGAAAIGTFAPSSEDRGERGRVQDAKTQEFVGPEEMVARTPGALRKEKDSDQC